MGFFDWLTGTPDKVKDYNPYSKGTNKIFDQLEGALGGPGGANQNALNFFNQILSEDPEFFDQLEGPMFEKFQQETIPHIMERFGGIGAQNSSALYQTLGQAQRSLGRDLQAQRAQSKFNAAQGVQNYSNSLLNRQNSPYVQGGAEGLLSGENGKNLWNAAGGALKGAGTGFISGGVPGAIWGGLTGLFS